MTRIARERVIPLAYNPSKHSTRAIAIAYEIKRPHEGKAPKKVPEAFAVFLTAVFNPKFKTGTKNIRMTFNNFNRWLLGR